MSEFTFTATGDSIIARRVHGLGNRRFEKLAAVIGRADAAFTNLELVTPKRPMTPSSEFGGIHLGMPPYVLDELQQTGFNLYALAHNHAVDFMVEGLLDTMEELEERDMVYAGAGHNLGEARSPAYIDTPGGRVALVAAASTFSTGAHAAEVRTDFAGRPGINPLRYKQTYVAAPEQLRQLRELDEALGTAEVTRREHEFGLKVEKQPEAYKFLGRAFVEGDEPGVVTEPKEKDLEAITGWISDARRQADFVVSSLHCHEGENGAKNTHTPAKFIVEAAHQFIDAGADVFVGHGPHLLRGLEIYRGKPSFYSLGNFMFMCENLTRMPAEMYELYDLPPTATPADVFDFESQDEDGSPKAFHAERGFWQTVLPLCRFEAKELVGIKLVPVSLGLDTPRSQRGLPQRAAGEEAEAILEQLAQLSRPFGTELEIKHEADTAVGHVLL